MADIKSLGKEAAAAATTAKTGLKNLRERAKGSGYLADFIE